MSETEIVPGSTERLQSQGCASESVGRVITVSLDAHDFFVESADMPQSLTNCEHHISLSLSYDFC